MFVTHLPKEELGTLKMLLKIFKTLPVRAYISIENGYKYGNISVGDSYFKGYVYSPVK
jgi:hypothetical protein